MTEIVVNGQRERMTRKDFEEARVLELPDHAYNMSPRTQRVLYKAEGESKPRWYAAYRTTSFGRSYIVLYPITVMLATTDL